MSITFWPVVPIVAAGPLLLTRYLRHARQRRSMQRLEDAFSFDAPRPWNREVLLALRSADNWVFAESLKFRRKRKSAQPRQLIPLAGGKRPK